MSGSHTLYKKEEENNMKNEGKAMKNEGKAMKNGLLSMSFV